MHENVFDFITASGKTKNTKLPVVGYGKQSISSLIAIGTPSRTERGSPGMNQNEKE